MNVAAAVGNRLPTVVVPRAILVAWLVCAGGCTDPASDESDGDGGGIAPVPVRLLVVDDEKLAGAIRRQWAAQGTGDVNVQQVTSDKLLELERLDADAVVYPSALIGELAVRNWIVPVPDDVLGSEPLDRNDVFRLLRLKETTWGHQTYALPLGSPQLVLFYRPDIFRRLGLEPPKTWREYEQLLPRLVSPDSSAALSNETVAAGEGARPAAPKFATVEPLAPGWAGQMLLARSASYARHRSQTSALFDYRTMEPLIDGPPFVRALEELKTAAEYGPADPFALTPADARRFFFESDVAMAVSWPTAADERPQSEGDGAPGDDESGASTARADGDKIAFAALPGSSQVYHLGGDQWDKRRPEESKHVPLMAVSGRMASVTRESARSRAAFSVLVWLTGREWSGRVSPASAATTLFRSSQMETAQAWVGPDVDKQTAKQYAELVAAAQTGSVWLVSLRVPGRGEYLAALDRAVERVVREEAEPAAALAQAAAEWNEITDRLGRDSQRAAYQRSLGIAR